MKKACKKLGISGRKIISGAGHDAKEIARKVPTGMIFVPSIAGKSHCPEEKNQLGRYLPGNRSLARNYIIYLIF